MMRPPPNDLLNAVEGPLVRVTADAAYDTVAVYETGGGAGCDGRRPTGQRRRTSPGDGPRSARAGSDDHVVVTDARTAHSGRRRQGTIVRAEWGTRSPATSPSSEMVFAPGAQQGRGVRSSSAAEILNRMTALGRPASYRVGR